VTAAASAGTAYYFPLMWDEDSSEIVRVTP